MLRSSLAALACLFASSCSSPSTAPDFTPLTPLASYEVQYEGQLTTDASLLSEELPEVPTTRGVLVPRPLKDGEPTECPISNPDRFWEPDAELSRVAVTCRIFEVGPELVTSLVNTDAPWLRADSVPRGEADALFAQLANTSSVSPYDLCSVTELLQPAGEQGTTSVMNRSSFIKSFKTKAGGAIFMADPEVGISQEGLWMGVEITDGGGTSDPTAACTVDLELRLVELQRPLAEATGHLPGTTGELTIQLPLFAAQTLKTSASMTPDEALLVGPIPTGDDERSLVLLLTIETRATGVASAR